MPNFNPPVRALCATQQQRRDAIKQLAAICGLALSTSSLALLAESFAQPRDMSRRKKRLLDSSQLALVRQIGELIIPATDTPGAIGADVHTFINHQAAYCLSHDQQQKLLKLLDTISTAAKKDYGQDFLLCEKARQLELLTRIEKADAGFSAEDKSDFKQFKSLVVFGYYSSEIGATKELAYDPIPGGYKGSVKFSTLGKVWSL